MMQTNKPLPAEQVAKLVSELRDIANSQFGPSDKQRQLFRDAATIIERTMQTQSTHGEDEAVAWKDAVYFVRHAVSTRSKQEC